MKTIASENDLPKNSDVLMLGFRDVRGNPTGPFPRQYEALEIIKTPYVEEVLLWGGTRSGKTSTPIRASIDFALERPGLRVLLGGYDLSSINASLLYHLFIQIPEKFTDLEGNETTLWTHDAKKQTVTVSIPGYIDPVKNYTVQYDYRPLDPGKRLHERLRISGASYGMAILDQIEMMTTLQGPNGRDVRDAVVTRIDQWPFKTVETANPKPGDWWVEEFIENEGKDLKKAVVHMNPGENPFVDERYLMKLRALPPELRARYLYGMLAHLTGYCLGKFRPEAHLYTPEWPIPSTCVLYEAIDPGGLRDPFAAQWWIVTPQDEVRMIFAETYRDCTMEDAARAILTRRDELVARGRPVGLSEPSFAKTISDPAVGALSKKRGSISEQLSAYKHHDGKRLICTPATALGIPAKSITTTRIRKMNDLFEKNKCFITSEAIDWITQQSEWVFDGNGNPADFRKERTDGTVEHHFDHIKCGLYFVQWYTRLYETGSTEVRPKRRDYGWGQSRQHEYRPLAELQC